MDTLNCLTKLYYIADGYGNFYKLSTSGQLIVATGKEAAETFTFTEANRRISGGKKAKFYHTVEVEESEQTEQEQHAETVHSESTDTDQSVSKVLSMVTENTKEEPVEEVLEEVEEETPDYDITQVDWMGLLEEFCFIADNLEGYKTELENRQFNLELRLQDLLHYVELCEMDEAESLQIMDEIRETRQHRRDVKDELQRIEYFQQSLGSKTNAGKCKYAIRQMEKLSGRIYHPRKIPELFENAQFREIRSFPYWNERQIANSELAQSSERYEQNTREDNEMPCDRVDTIFDGRENDWLAFARQQKEFYENVYQHMTNLEMDIEAIDGLIEEILIRIEDANFNVTQGYKVFKELKDLRNEKKSKVKELEALHVLTERIDCQYMSEELDISVRNLEMIYEPEKKTADPASQEETEPVACEPEKVQIMAG